MAMKIVCDFETHNHDGADKTGVWAVCICDLNNIDNIMVGDSIDDFFDFCKEANCDIECYYHNLKFDGEFIIYHLLNNDYEYSNVKKLKEKEFKTFIDSNGVFYSITFKLEGHTIKIYDSLKKIPLSVDSIANSYLKGVELNKGIIDYTKDRTHDYKLEEHEDEIEYIKSDCQIVALALKQHFDKGMNKMTLSGDAFKNYVDLSFKGNMQHFRRRFPCLDSYKLNTTIQLLHNDEEVEMTYDDYIRKAYVGGWTYVNTHHKKYDKVKRELSIYSDGCVLDVNSEHPYSMHSTQGDFYDVNGPHLMPMFTPLFFKGKAEDNIEEFQKSYCRVTPIYIQHLKIDFELKERGIPCIKNKHSSLWIGEDDWLETSNHELYELWVTNVDLDLIFDNYNINDIEYIDCMLFVGAEGLFDIYIDHWINEKVNATKAKDAGRRQIAKLLLNGLGGKFGQRTKSAMKVPKLVNNQVKYEKVELEDRESYYTAVSVFMCAYSRRTIIKAAMSVYDHFCYADTDSLHLDCPYSEIKSDKIRVDSAKLGYFDLESEFVKARFIKSKCYIECTKNGELDGIHDEIMMNIKVAGLLRSYMKRWDDREQGKITREDRKQLFKDLNIDFEDFHRGLIIKDGSNKAKRIKGGVILKRGDFEIK